MLTVLEIIKRTTDFLAGKGVESPRLQAELLIGHALGLKRMQLYLQFERPLTEAELEGIRPLVRRRGLREPLQHIVGEVEFGGLSLKVDRRALIPRPETEYLVSLLAERLASPGTILDLGTGTGAIALALAAAFPAARVLAVDASEDAVALARENAARAGLEARVEVRRSDWFQAVGRGEVFDLIVSNPPYLSATEAAATAAEVREHEPAMALSPGADGLEAIERIVPAARDFLAHGGTLALETGIAQHDRLRGLLAEAGLEGIEFAADLTGRPRFAFARAPQP